jgi:hypothetical protein
MTGNLSVPAANRSTSLPVESQRSDFVLFFQYLELQFHADTGYGREEFLSPAGLTGALDGVEAVISCIGPEKNLSPGTLMSVGVASILTECKRANVRRFIMQSGIGVSDGRELSCFNRLVVRVSGRIFTAAITDKAVAERMTQKIEMEWVIVRPVVLIDKPAKGRYTAGPSARVAPLVPLSLDDCADCLLRATTDEPNWIGKIVNVGS